MKQFEIIPAIDLIDGKCVRLTQGDYSACNSYSDNPLGVALAFENAGIRRLHIVDLDGAKKGSPANLKTLELIARNTNLIIDFGGGISEEKQAKDAFNAGAAMLSIGSLAATQPEKFKDWLNSFGADKFLLAADVRDGQVKVNGWQSSSGYSIFEFIDLFTNTGLTNVFCTDIASDGMLEGPSTLLYRKLVTHYPGLNIIASGGVSSVEDILTLNAIGCAGAIVGKAIYENRISLANLTKFVQNAC